MEIFLNMQSCWFRGLAFRENQFRMQQAFCSLREEKEAMYFITKFTLLQEFRLAKNLLARFSTNRSYGFAFPASLCFTQLLDQ